MNLQINDLDLSSSERDAAQRVAERLHAETVSLYRTREGLKAYVRDAGGGEHLGVLVESAIEREVRLEEEMNADLIERQNLRGINPPDY